MAELNRVVKGTPEQLTEILTEGSITVDDITVTREEIESGSTLFDTGRLDQMALNQQVKADMHRLYGYNHESFAVDDIEAVYNDIIENNPSLASKSAVGFTAVLKTGESIYTQSNILYINGILCEGLTSDGEAGYTFTGTNGVEIINGWYFDNNNILTANRINADVVAVSVKVKGVIPATSADFFDYADSVTINASLSGKNLVGVKKQKNISGGDGSSDYISNNTREYESFCEYISTGQNAPTSGHGSLKKVSFPFLRSVAQTSPNKQSFLYNCTGLEEIYFPMLTTVGGGGNNSPFQNVKAVTLPSSVLEIGPYTFSGNQTVSLECNEATDIDDEWCKTTPTVSFQMAEDWAATINIATAADRWTLDDFINLFTNVLRDMDDDVRELKIPSTIYDSLTDEEFEIAEDKGWTIGC